MSKQRWSTGQLSSCSGVIAASIPNFGMNIYVMCNMLTTKQNNLLHIDLFLQLVLVSHQGLLWILSFIKRPQLRDTVMWTRPLGSLNRSRRSTRQYRNNWKRSKPSTRLGMTSIGWNIVFKLEIRFGCILTRIGCKVKVKS